VGGGGGGGGGETLIYKKDGSARRAYQGLKTLFWYLLGCSASKGPQRELSRYLSGY